MKKNVLTLFVKLLLPFYASAQISVRTTVNEILIPSASTPVAENSLTIDGISCSDPENENSYFSRLPYFASSIDKQLERSIGTNSSINSSGGAGAFDSGISVHTINRMDTAYAELNNSYGSFSTWKNSLRLGTGLIKKKFSLDGLVSNLHSNAYMDYGNSDLQFYFLRGAYQSAKNLLRMSVFSGRDKTIPGWGDGIPQNVAINSSAANPFSYNQQVDNRNHNRYQLLYTRSIFKKSSFDAALHYSYGRGFYDETQIEQNLANYGIPNTNSLTKTSFLRRRWLDNDFRGAIYAFNYQLQTNLKFTFGGTYSRHKGTHVDEVIWAQNNSVNNPQRYHNDSSIKELLSTFLKTNYQLGRAKFFANLEYENIQYSFTGTNSQSENIAQTVPFHFFNPKFGLDYRLNPQDEFYTSFSMTNGTPQRQDYINSTSANRPQEQHSNNFNLGYRRTSKKLNLTVSTFSIFYKNQLVGTGKLSDLGEWLNQNVLDSYRIGFEFDGKIQLHPKLSWATTAVLSSNRIQKFVADPNTAQQRVYTNTPISASPAFVAASELAFNPVQKFQIAFLNKYLSRQYFNNTANDDQSIKPFLVSDVRLSYTTSLRYLKNTDLSLLINNIFGTSYSAISYYNYVENGSLTGKTYYFPQGGQNFLLSLSIKF